MDNPPLPPFRKGGMGGFERRKTMQVLIWLIFLIALGIAIFAVQNSNAPLVIIKFLFWKFETSLVYTILGSVGLGILLPLLFWISRTLRASFQTKTPPHEISKDNGGELQKK
jgi:uncharacterized integral membrane protein